MTPTDQACRRVVRRLIERIEDADIDAETVMSLRDAGLVEWRGPGRRYRLTEAGRAVMEDDSEERELREVLDAALRQYEADQDD